MKLILTLLVVALTGCGATMPPAPPANHNIAFTATNKHVEKLVNWVAVDDINAVCQQFIEKGKKILVASIIGIIVAFSALVIVRQVAKLIAAQ